MSERVVLLVAVVLVVAIVLLLVRSRLQRRTAERLGQPLPDGVAVGQPGTPTVLYFYGPACAACITQKQALQTLPAERVNVVSVDAAREPELASWAGVLTIPSTAIVDQSRRLRAVNHGFKPATELSEQLAGFA